MAFKYTPVEERFPKPGYLESAGRNLVGGAANVVGLLTEGFGELGTGAVDAGFLPDPFGLTKGWFGLNRDIGSWLSEQGRQIQQPARLSPQWENKDFLGRVTNWNYWTDPQGATADIFSGLGTSAPFMGAGLGARAAGLVLPTRQIARNLFGKSFDKFAKSRLGNALVDTADTGLNYAATVAPIDAMTNAAEIIKPLKERGFTDEEISRLMLGSMAEELPTDLLENFITGNVILGKGFGLRGRTWKGRLGYGSLNIPLEMGGEYMQEGYQTRATQKYQGLPYTESPLQNFINTGELFRTPEERSAAVSGAIGGILPAGIGTATHAAFGTDAKDEAKRDSTNYANKHYANRRSWEVADSYRKLADAHRNAQTFSSFNDDNYSTANEAAGLSTEDTGDNVSDIRSAPRDNYFTTGNDYRGEGGRREGVYWARQNDSVSIEGAQPETLNLMDAMGKLVYDRTGKPATISAVTNGDHAGGEYSHDKGWKFDLHDGGFGAEGALITDDYQKGALADEFMEYWQARGVGVNLEKVGTPDVHFDISTAGYQWKDNDGNDLAQPFYRSGFNAKDTASPELENTFDPNFTERQNQVWQAAQYAAQRARDKYGINIPPELIYKQWVHEDGGDFTHPTRNWGGLTQNEPNEWPQPDGNAYYRTFADDKEYADAYVDDFIRLRPELNGVKTEREFATIMKDTDYYGSPLEEYVAGMERAQVPKSGFRGGASTADDTSTEESNDPDSIYQRLIADILNEDTKPIFDATGDDETTRSILSAFAADKRDGASGNDFITLSSMFDAEGEFINSKANRKTLADLYGDELAEFGQAALDEQLAQLADKNSSVENLTVDDRKLLSGVLKAKLEDAGTKVNGHFLKRLNEGAADTFNKALGSLGSVKQTVLPENLSNEISRLRDELKTLSDKAIQTSDKAEFADINKQIKAHDAKINSIQTLGKDIAKLEADLQKASDNFVKANATGNATKIATASDKVTKLQTQLDAKQAELTKIISPQVQDATPQTPPANRQTADFMANANAQIQQLKAQLTPDLSREQTLQLTQQIQDQTATLDKVNKLNAQIDTLTTKAAEALVNVQNPANPTTQAAAIKQFNDATKQLQAKEAELAKIITPQVRDATPAPSKKFAPLKAQAEEAVAKFDARIAELRAQDEIANEAEIESLTDRRYAIQAAVDETAKLDAKFQPLIQTRNAADKAKDAAAYNGAQKKLGKLRKDYKSASTKLENLLSPQETPQAQETFAPVEDFVADELASIAQQKAELDAQGLRENAGQITKLNQRRDKIQRGNNEIAKLNAQTSELENQLSQTTEPAAQEKLKDQLSTLYSSIDGKKTALANFINPPQKSQPETFEPSADFQAKVDEINARMRELRNAGEAKNSADISTLSRQAKAMESAAKKVYHFTAQRDQAELDGNAKEVQRLTGEIADWNKKIANAIKRADEVLNPPQKAEKKRAEAYPVLPEFQSELDGIKSRMNELRADDEEKNSAEIAKLADRDADIRKANDDIAKWTAARVEKERQRTEAERNGDDKTSMKLSGEIATLNGNIRNARRNLVNNLASTEAPEVSQTMTATRFVQEALAPPAKGNDKAAQKSRREKGKKLIILAAQTDIQLDDDTRKSLERGKQSTIIETQRRLLDSDKLFNRPQEQETRPTENTDVIEDLKLAHGEISQDKDERKAQGAAIVRVANFTQRVNNPQFQQQFGKARVPKIDLPDGMERDLLNGDENAIRKAQEIFTDAGLVIRDSSEQAAENVQSDGLRGNTVEVITASRTAHQVRYRVVEANDLVTSHKLDDTGVVENKNYPDGLQPRDRTRVDMQAQAVKMSNNLKPADLMEARDVNQGAPVIRNDGVVLNGNGRTMAIQRAYEIGRGDAYKNALIENAEQFGLNANAISRMNQPVLVRELTHDLNNAEIQDLTKSQTGGAQFSASDRAKADAKAISLAAFDELPQTGDVDLTSAAATDFLRAILRDITKSNPGELNALTDKDGKISSDGINRVKRALFALAYGDDDFIARMSESTDDNVKGATNAFANAAPTLAKVQAAMRKGYLHSYDLKDLIAAVKKLSALRDEGKTVKGYLAGQSIFAEYADTNEMREVLSFLDDNKHAPNKITAFLKKIAQGIQAQGDPRQGVLFGTNEAKPLIDLIRKARNDVENNGMSDLFSPKPKAQPSTPKPEVQSTTQPTVQSTTQPETQSTPQPAAQSQAKPELKQREDKESLFGFGTDESSTNDLLDAFANFDPAKFNEEDSAESNDVIPEDKFINVVDDSDEANQKDIAELRKELNKLSAMPMFNPKVWTLGLKIGIRYLQRGINNFVAWAKKLRQDIGEDFEPWQKPLWETLKAMPKIEKFNDKQIWSTAKRIGYLYENGTTELEDIEKDFAEKLSAETMKAITPMIRATYKGIQKFFADQQQASEEAQEPETKKAAVTVTGDEFGEYDGIDELRKKAVQYYSEHLQGTSVENETLGKIDIDENGLVNFTGSGKRELKNSSAKINKLLLVKHLPELIQNSTDITGKHSTKERHKGDYFYYLHTSAQIDGKTIPVEITVVKRNNRDIQYYNHTLPSEEKTKDAVVSTEPESSNEALGTLSIPASAVEVETSAKNISQSEQSDKDKRNFEMGNFTNPETNQTQTGIRFTKILPQKEYARLEDIAAEYNGIYHEHGNMILFRDESDRDAFIDDASGNYRGTEITKPISQARTVTQLKQIFREVYRVDLGAVEGLSMNIRRLKEFVGGLVDSLADAGLMKFVNGEVEYSDAKAYEDVKNAFAGMVQRKGVDTTSKEPLPTIDSLKKKIRATLADWNDAKITVSPQWDDAEERAATDAEEFSIIPTRTLAGDIFKISYGNFGLAAYDTESQALKALDELNAAIKRGDKKFVFPNDEQIEQTSPAEDESTAVNELSSDESEQRAQELLRKTKLVDDESKKLFRVGLRLYSGDVITIEYFAPIHPAWSDWQHLDTEEHPANYAIEIKGVDKNFKKSTWAIKKLSELVKNVNAVMPRDTEDDRQLSDSRYVLFSTLNDARVFAKALEIVSDGQVKTREDLKTLDNVNRERKESEERATRLAKARTARQSLPEKQRDFSSKTYKIPDGTGIKVGDNVYLWDNDREAFFDRNNRRWLTGDEDSNLDSVLQLLIEYGDEQKAIEVIDYQAKHEPSLWNFGSRNPEKAKDILRNNSFSFAYLDEEDYSVDTYGDDINILYGNGAKKAIDAAIQRQLDLNEDDDFSDSDKSEESDETIPAEQAETVNEPESTEPTTQGEIVYPDGALTYGDKSAVDAFKGGYKDKNFDENNKRTITIDGREMTRLEAVEEIAKGNLDESAMKLNKREREYLDWLRGSLIEPLKAIQQAGIQNERADKVYRGMIDGKAVYFEGSKNDAATLAQLTKLAEAFGGTAQKNQSDNTRFNFTTPRDAWEFQRGAKFFMDNIHVAYFNPDDVQQAERNERKQLAADKNQPADVRAQAALELNPIDKNSLYDGVKVSAVQTAQNKQGVWRVKLVGTFPIIKNDEDLFGKTNTLWATNGLFDDLSKSLGGTAHYADETWHFKDKSDATAFKAALDIFFGFKKAPTSAKIRPVTEDDTAGFGAVINNDAINQLVTVNAAFKDFKSQVATVGKKVTDMVKTGTLTQTEAEEIAGDLMDEINDITRQFDAGELTQTEAQQNLREAIDNVTERLERASVDNKIKTPSEEKALDLFTLFSVEKPESPTDEFTNTYREIQNAWNDFLDGENDILETADKVNAIVGEFSATPSSERYLHERKILNTFRDKIRAIKPSPELQKQFDRGWEIFFTLERTFDKMHDKGKISDDEYKKKRKIIDDFEQKIRNEKITPVKAAVKLQDLLPEVTKEEIQNYLSTRNEKREATLLRMAKDPLEAINVFYDGSLIDTDALDRSIESGEWDKLIAQLPEKTIENLLAEARRAERELEVVGKLKVNNRRSK